jgi:alkanesulfonate monooxygenase SsuD/methylene tetrahydromethanopterin reductase-like flavin-dependent oxidoreductase (luciferase family)
MTAELPALNLIAAPGKRRATLDIAREIERRGFSGISVSSQFRNMAQCFGLAFATERIPFATAIAPIYAQTADDFAHGAAYLHEVSGGRFQFGIVGRSRERGCEIALATAATTKTTAFPPDTPILRNSLGQPRRPSFDEKRGWVRPFSRSRPVLEQGHMVFRRCRDCGQARFS